MWQEQNNFLTRTFLFKNFIDAFAFMTAVAVVAEEQGHHPNWSNVWNKVEIKLNTHDAGNIVTPKDYRLAKAIDLIFDS